MTTVANSELVISRISSIISSELDRVKRENNFFQNFPSEKKAESFEWCSNLYHLSKHFGELLKLRWERFPDVEHEVFSTHYDEEKDHAEMLRKWMIGIGLDDPELHKANYETEHFISLQYRAVAAMDENLSLLIINSTSEGFAHAVYLHAYKILQEIGFSNLEYWAIHCEADEEHSDVYHLIKDMSVQQLEEAEHLVKYTCNTLDVMLDSWLK
ncbi:iron-containing redox enzyme family protein [Paenibacillus sp. FJAT-26967]|uniref:iron-containing redox enzyme family protein n=1 Tax=Paenibacillus sp. FJAT-26967 TaxID=1729690 RepID=UPI000838E71B|nr:iron-containing redox enzyme family protein [Paenibacillus sp. FJAT-26967]